MEDSLISILETFKFPVYRQGSLSASDAYPDDFFTFWNNDSPDHAYYNNHDYGTMWAFQVNFYSNSPSNTYSYIASAIKALKDAGWVVGSKGYDVTSDEETHTGRGFDCYFLEV